jgi:hypothetical protein
MIETIQFNIGGQLYTVTKSLIEMYPHSRLYKLVSEHKWLKVNLKKFAVVDVVDNDEDNDDEDIVVGDNGIEECKKHNNSHNRKDHDIIMDPNNNSCDDTLHGVLSYDQNEDEDNYDHDDDDDEEEEEDDESIFIDRDPQIFRHVLNYLRDQKVILPITIDKNTFLSELSFYGIYNTTTMMDDDGSVSKEEERILNNITVSNQGANVYSVLQINGLILSMEKEEYCIRFARFCIVQFKDYGSGMFRLNRGSNGNSTSSGCSCHGNEFQFIVRSTDYTTTTTGNGSISSGSSCNNDSFNKKSDNSLLYQAVEVVANGGCDMKERSNVYLRKFGLFLKEIDGTDKFRQRTKFKVILEVLSMF